MNTTNDLKQDLSKNLTPGHAIELLQEGNRRFVSGLRSVNSMSAHMKMADLAAHGQKPFAIVLTCSDSRSPAELIFDQGVGDLFVVRVAGNVVAPSLLASIEFAIANFGSAAVVVLGHSKCGAVNATIEHARDPATPLPSPNLEELVGRIRPSIEAVRQKGLSPDEYLHQATLENVRHSIRVILEQSRITRSAVEAGKVAVTGALLDLSTGIVKFMNDTGELELDQRTERKGA